jgi:hypothetical protein
VRIDLPLPLRARDDAPVVPDGDALLPLQQRQMLSERLPEILVDVAVRNEDLDRNTLLPVSRRTMGSCSPADR